ncbi:MAG: hypothetical protein IJQ20_01820 [Paludibacteraceae bacterium]|nr:hypothetical protein [Paludibacteraceae bacterium]
MEELVKYFEALEARLAADEARIASNDERIAALEAELASVEAELDELKSRPAQEPKVIEKEVIKEVPVEVIKEVVVEKPVVVAAPAAEPEPVVDPKPVVEPDPVIEPIKEEPASPKAAVYGKAVDDIRLAISLGDRFLYQRELFGQNAELMQRTLNELNELNSFDEAIRYISRFNWDTESSTYQQFLVTLHRRFG